MSTDRQRIGEQLCGEILVHKELKWQNYRCGDNTSCNELRPGLGRETL